MVESFTMGYYTILLWSFSFCIFCQIAQEYQSLDVSLDGSTVAVAETTTTNLTNSSPTESGVVWIEHIHLGISISSTEISVGTYSKCISENQCSLDYVDLAKSRPGCTLVLENDPITKSYPVNCVNYYGAQQVCSWLGGNICSESVWNSACGWKGEHNNPTAYPYGNEFVEDNCLVGTYDDRLKLEPIGSRPYCKGGLPGLYDMGGSLSEWLSDGSGTYRKFKPVSYAFNGPSSKAPCSKMCAGNQMDFKTTSVGVRCCKPLESPLYQGK